MNVNWTFLAIAVVVNVILAAASYTAGAVSLSGVAGGIAVGTAILFFGGWGSFAILMLFFVLGSVATKLGYKRKADLGVAQEDKGRRGAKHALANCGTGAAAAFVFFAGTVLMKRPEAEMSWALVVLAGAFATALFDTASSEIGQLYGRHPFLITTFRAVPVGTDGAVSVEGTLAGFAAGALVGAAGFAAGLYGAWGILAVTAGAFIGTTFESIIGAIGTAKERFNNELLNFLNTVVGGVTAGAIFFLLTRK